MAIWRPPPCSTQSGSGGQCDALGCREALSQLQWNGIALQFSLRELVLRTVEKIPGGYQVLDSTGQSFAHVYGRETKADAAIANVLIMDEARRIASKHRQAA